METVAYKINKSFSSFSLSRSNKRDNKRDKASAQIKYQTPSSSAIATLSSVKKQQLPCTSAGSSQQQNQILNTSGSSLQSSTECTNSDSSSLANSSCGSNNSDQVNVGLLGLLEEKVSGYNSGDEHVGTKEHNLSTEEWEKRDEKFGKLLKERGFVIKEMEEDGACLFRAISYQIYGDQEMHDTIRQQTMDYIYQNREYFAQFITEGKFFYIKIIS